MSDSGGFSSRRARPPRRAGVRAALVGLILFGGAAAYVWFAGHAAQPARVASLESPAAVSSEQTMARQAASPDRVASGAPQAPTTERVGPPISGTAATTVTGSPASAAGLGPRPIAGATNADPSRPSPAAPNRAVKTTTTAAGPTATGPTATDPMSATASAVEQSPNSPPGAPDRAPIMVATAGPTATARSSAVGRALPPASPVEAVPPSFDIARVTSRGDAVLAGRAAPDALVTISAGGKTIAQTRADADGQWVALPVAALPAGASELSLAARAPAADIAVPAAASLLIVVPQPVPPVATPTNTAPPNAAPTNVSPTATAAAVPRTAEPSSPQSTLALLLPQDGPPRLLQRPAAETAMPTPPGKPIAATLNLDQVDYATGGAIRFAGTAHPGASVRLYVDEVAVGETVADIAGRWALQPAAAIAVGPHRVRVDEIGIRGRVLARIALPFERSAIAPEDALAGRVVVQPRQTLWRIARRAYGRGVEYTIIYQANREQIADPDRIFPGQIFSVPGPPAK